MECLENIIGLTRTECECINQEEGSDQSVSESASGIYLDEIDGFNINVAESADDCAKGSLIDRMFKAVENAKYDFVTNTLGCVNRRFKPRADTFAGQLGEPNNTQTLNLSTQQAGIRLRPYRLRSANIEVSRIGIIINQAVNVTVKVMKKVNSITEEVGSYTTSSPMTAGTLTWLALEDPLVLPMYDDRGVIDYYFLLQLDGSFQPKNNKKDCGCSGVKRPYLAWLDFKGTKGNQDYERFTDTTELNGLMLDVKVTCNQKELICSEERPLDFENDGIAREIAYAIRLKAASKLYQDVLSSGNINRYTLLNREYMDAKVQEWNTEYAQWIEWYCGSIEVSNNDCFVCRDGKNIIKGNILA